MAACAACQCVGGGVTARVACFTSFTFAYLARARVLAESVRRVHPEWVLWAVVTDVADGVVVEGFDHVVDAAELGIEGFAGWLFKHDVVEACTAVKATMLRHLLGLGAEKVIYLDPDIAVFAPPDLVVERLEGASIVLTPHQVAPDTTAEGVRDNEGGSMRFGVFNLGFLGVRNDRTGRDFAAWWEERLLAACYDAPEAGIFTDQKYCDLVPALFAEVHVERDAGCNVASWNIARRPVRVMRAGDVMTARCAGENFEVHELVAWYKRALASMVVAGGAGMEGHPWHYGKFGDGSAIPRAARLLWRERGDLRRAFADPFDPRQLRAWLVGHEPGILGIEAEAVCG